ncbi:hypothetical protein BS47DRAFT_1371709 [Hydnum rufescens UP504]|uniref:Malic enzyme n=1 Tax=Hydnum rufescens UP504 TaxID=1448309 RepID=A0A9P6B3A4_9AGAM|nr:hypothetical protein BS47DRAFT_1371709 [Hydnum rufescens UP504]
MVTRDWNYDQLIGPTPSVVIPTTSVAIPTTAEDDMQKFRWGESTESTRVKFIYLSQLKLRDSNSFYTLLVRNMSEITPLIYTPTVGEACVEYSQIYRNPEGLFVSILDKGSISSVVRNWPKPHSQARITVITDGSRILGLGDLGVNGMPISIGKLSLYIAGAGIHPDSTIPICLDLGTNNERNLSDPLYLGLKRRRSSEKEMTEFMQELMEALSTTFPRLLVQFEDFSTDNAFKYLEMFRHSYKVFNDDIQGTGGVVLSGFTNAARIASKDPNSTCPNLGDHKVLFLGAGSAGIGGLSEDEARERIWTVDSKGIVVHGKPGLAEHKKYFARRDMSLNDVLPRSLVDIVRLIKPTALLGLSTIRNAFTKEVVEAMSELNERPIIFPLSNPVHLSECDYSDAVEWSKGKVVFASGSPFPKYQYEGRTYEPGQGNNMYIFPGLGLGTILCHASEVTDSMVNASAISLADSVSQDEKADGLIYPRLHRIRDISVEIALGTIRAAQRAGVANAPKLTTMDDDQLRDYIRCKQWLPADGTSKL